MQINILFHFFLFLSLILMPFKVQSQAQPGDRILGIWINEEKDGEIEIYKTGNKYFGKIVAANNLYEQDGKTLRKDMKNPEPKFRSRTLLNLVILTDFDFVDDEWTDGRIYDPKSGKTYSSTMKLNNGRLELRGFVGISLLGRTTVWDRAH